MGKKIFSWTVSVIAMLERDDKIQWEAYEEFERSITTLKYINKDIGFLIYLYDVKDLTAYTKKSKVVDGRYHLEMINSEEIGDFYGDEFRHIIHFFSEHVAKKNLEECETHRHFLITWGHGTGIGFFARKEKQEIEALFRSNKLESKPYESDVDDTIHLLRFLRSQLSLSNQQINYEKILQETSPLGSQNFSKNLTEGISNHVRDSARKCISAIELADIIKKGLKDDISSRCCPKINFLLCLTCYTQMIETGFALKDVVDIMVAPETTISHYGYNYEKLFELLACQPAAIEKPIANCLANNYLSKYESEYLSAKIGKNERIHKIEYRRLVSFNALRLKQYEEVAKAISEFVKFVLSPANTITIFENVKIPALEAFKRARLKCLETSYRVTKSIGVVDFNNLFMKFCEFYPSNEFRNIADQYSQVRKTYDEPGELILAQYYPGYYSHIREEDRIMSLNAGFFGVFLPKSTSLQQREISIFDILNSEIALPGSFWHHTGWHQLIKVSS